MKEIKDGIINVELYKNSIPKVLWILKEGNVSEEDKNKERNICNEINNGQHIDNALGIPTFRKMIYATYGIFNPDVSWEEIPLANNLESYNTFKNVGYININKMPGGQKSDYQIIQDAYLKYESFIIKQIIDMKPNIIIFGGTYQFFTYEACAIFGFDTRNVEKKYLQNGTVASIEVSNEKLVIDAYHPAYFRVSDKNYWYGIREAVMRWRNRG
ncbi:MAG TPA: hypothetical protein PLZ52_08215 [Bacteroidales bacterium]|nr:hypothetical protein [Bacteroidales bacterium]